MLSHPHGSLMPSTQPLISLARFLRAAPISTYCRLGSTSNFSQQQGYQRLRLFSTANSSQIHRSYSTSSAEGRPGITNDFNNLDGDEQLTSSSYNDGSFYDDSIDFSTPSWSQQQQENQPEATGAFQKIPMVAPSREILDSALRRATRVPVNKKLKNEAAKAKNKAARQLDALMKELTTPLGAYEKGFPPVKRLHPFEISLLELTLGEGTYERVLNRVTTLRKASVEVAKGYAARCSKAVNKKEAIALQEEGFARVEAVYQKNAAAVDELKELAKSLRRLPVVDPELPTVALVGAPNVGKSSLVQLLSSGLPDIQNYPFTTRSIKMGHFYVDGRRHQVTDTPGLLNRPDKDRNAMERLTLASLEHLPTAVLVVVDLTGDCGTSVVNQWQIRRDLKQKFGEKPWIDVFSKTDLLEEEFDAADEIIKARGGEFVEPETVKDSIEFAASLPDAVRVSSVTGLAIDELKAAMLDMLEKNKLGGDVEQEVVEQ